MANSRFRISDWFYNIKCIGSKSKGRHQNRQLAKGKVLPSSTTGTPSSMSLCNCSSEDKFCNTHNPPVFPCLDPHRKSGKIMKRRGTSRSGSPKIVPSSSCTEFTDIPARAKHARLNEFLISSSEKQRKNRHYRPRNAAISSAFCKHWDAPSINELAPAPVMDLPPILTKAPKSDDIIFDLSNEESEPSLPHRSSISMDERSCHVSRRSRGGLSIVPVKDEYSTARRSASLNSPGFRLRAHSPRLASKWVQAYRKRISSASRSRRLSRSLAVVKSSSDPRTDFRDSMLEMITENGMRDPQELEDLLACYLSLNSIHYHDLIVKIFTEIWHELTDDIPLQTNLYKI